MKNFLKNLLAVFSMTLFSAAAQAVVVMQPLDTFGTNGDGTIRPGDLYYLTSSNQWQRGMAYNPTTGHLLVVDRSTNTATSGNCDVYILDGSTGSHFGLLDNSFTYDAGNTSFKMNLIGIADDGAIYVANLSSATTPPQFTLYRWADEASPKTLVFPNASFPIGDPSNGNTNSNQRRWGDTMAVRGSGINTEILIGNRGNLAAILKPTDGTLATFTATTLTTDAEMGALSIGLTFGSGNTFWTTSGGFGNGPLLLMEYNLGAGTASTTSLFPPSEFPGTISPILAVPSSNLLAGITMVSGADVVRLYDTSDLESGMVLLDRKSFVTTNSNNNFAGSLALGTNGVLYALDSDNGIRAFVLTNAEAGSLPVAIFQNPASQTALVGTNVVMSVGADGGAPITYQWYFGSNTIAGATSSSLTLTNVQLTNAGNYSVVVSNPPGNVVTSSVATLTVLESLPGTLLVYDPFPYTVGSFLATDPTNGQGSWKLVTGTGAASPVVEAGNLVVPGLADSISNKITWGTTTMSIRSVITPDTSVAAGSIYFSYAYKLDATSTVPAAGANGGAVAGLGDASSATYAYKITIHTNLSGAPGYNIGVFKRGGETYGGFATNIIGMGDTVFIVGRYTINEANTTDDTCALWVNPDPSTFGATNPPIPSVGDGGIVPNSGTPTTDTPFSRFHFRQASGPSKSYADEVRVGQAWADVTPPAVVVVTPPKLAVTLSNTTAIISWPTNATGFNLEGAANLNSPIGWAAVTNSVIVNGTNNTVTISASSGNQFFRLRK